MNHRVTRQAIVWMLFLLPIPAATALEPREIVILTNKNMPESLAIAKYYCEKRKVPVENILAFDLPRGEDISRSDYDARLLAPLRDQLRERKKEIKVLLTVHGVPLRVGRVRPRVAEREERNRLQQTLKPLADEKKSLDEQLKDAPAEERKPLQNQIDQLQKQIGPLEEKINFLDHAESEACVDSELSMLWVEQYEHRRWVLNLRNWIVPQEVRDRAPPIVMTCRLDGPDIELIKKIIDTSIAVEAKGLAGKVYVDARGIAFVPKDDGGTGYGGYDESMREMARLLKDKGRMDVTLDDRGELFAPESCPDCALYCGWYSLANYVPCCKFVPGAVAWHLASSEAVTLRDPKARYWCVNLLKEGVVATLGPVAEPYTIGFPKPAEFFGFLVTGEYPLVECYWRTLLFTSWMTVLVGDPLYNPYAKTPRLKSSQIKASPVGGELKINIR